MIKVQVFLHDVQRPLIKPKISNFLYTVLPLVFILLFLQAPKTYE
jgi:hypothetical protein